MSQRTRVQLVTQIVTDLPDNEEGLISPEDVRNVLVNMLDSTYMPEDSGSLNANYAATASFVLNSETSSYALNSNSSSYSIFAQTASYINASGVVGLNLSRIATGSLTASLNIEGDVFSITSAEESIFAISDTYGLKHGFNSIATGSYSHVEGVSSNAIGDFSHAEGYVVTAEGYASHAEGFYTYAEGDYSHAEGAYNRTIGLYSHAEGAYTTASGEISHTEGANTSTIGYASHAEGIGTVASGAYQHAQGMYNLLNNTSSLMVIGNGTTSSRSDLIRFDIDGIRPYKPIIFVTGSNQTRDLLYYGDKTIPILTLYSQTRIVATATSSLYDHMYLYSKNISTGSFLTSSYSTLAIGPFALQNLSLGNANVAIGHQALPALNVGSSNVAIGSWAGEYVTSSVSSVFIGNDAGANINGAYNTFIGYAPGYSPVTSRVANFSDCIIIGAFSMAPTATSARIVNNTTVIGRSTITDLSNVAIIGAVGGYNQNVLMGKTDSDDGKRLQVVGGISLDSTLYLGTLPTASNFIASGSNVGGSLTSGSYYYTVYALDYLGNNTITCSYATADITSSSGSVYLSWTGSSDASSYRIVKSTTGSYFGGISHYYYNTVSSSVIDTGTNFAAPILNPAIIPAKNTTIISYISGSQMRMGSDIIIDRYSKKIGIGTITPTYNLDVSGSIRSTSNIINDSGSNLLNTFTGSTSIGYTSTPVSSSRLNIFGNTNIEFTANRFLYLGVRSGGYTDIAEISTTNATYLRIAPNGPLWLFPQDPSSTIYLGTNLTKQTLSASALYGTSAAAGYGFTGGTNAAQVWKANFDSGGGIVGNFIFHGSDNGAFAHRITSTSSSLVTTQISGQLQLHKYLTTSSFTGALTGLLGFDSTGNVISVQDRLTGVGTAGQVTYWSGTSAVTGSATLTYTPTTALLVNNSVTASGAIARGINFTPTLTAAANNDVLVGLDVAPTFTNGAFTGVNNITARFLSTRGNIIVESTTNGQNSAMQLNARATNGDLTGAGFYNIQGGTISNNRFAISADATNVHLNIFRNGNVLIQNGGTFTDAGYRLDVNGTGRFQNDVVITGSVTSSPALTLTNGGFRIGSTTGFNYDASNSNLGIGVAPSAAYRVDINGTGASTGAFRVVGGVTTIQGAGSTSATNALVVNNSGSVNLFTVRNDGLSSFFRPLTSSGTIATFYGYQAPYQNEAYIEVGMQSSDNGVAILGGSNVSNQLGGFLQTKNGTRAISFDNVGAVRIADGQILSTRTSTLAIGAISTLGSVVPNQVGAQVAVLAKNINITGTSTLQNHIAMTGFGVNTLTINVIPTTYTHASTLYIDGSPTTGSSVTFTNRWSIYANQGNIYSNDNLYIGTFLKQSWLNIAAPTTSKAQINLASGSAPTSPNEGDIWHTSGSLYLNSTATKRILNTEDYCYGVFTDTTNQTVAVINTAYTMSFNTVEESSSVYLSNSTRMHVTRQGVYNLQFSAQLDNTSGGTQEVYIWVRKNGTDIPRSNTQMSLQNNAKSVASWNIMTSMNANDYLELMWGASSTNVQLTYISTVTGPPRPVTPSVIATLNRVA
jgi:hypothetical protein